MNCSSSRCSQVRRDTPTSYRTVSHTSLTRGAPLWVAGFPPIGSACYNSGESCHTRAPCTRGSMSLKGPFASLGLLRLRGLPPFSNSFCAGSSRSQRSVVRLRNGGKESSGTGTTLTFVPDMPRLGISLSNLTQRTRLRCLRLGVSRSSPIPLPALLPPRRRSPPVRVRSASVRSVLGPNGGSLASPLLRPLLRGPPPLRLLALPLFLALGLPAVRAFRVDSFPARAPRLRRRPAADTPHMAS